MNMILPIGSVVIIRQSDRRLMVIGRDQQDKKTNETFDYIACYFPEGVQESSRVLHFNKEDILLVFALGYLNEDELRLRKQLEKKGKEAES